MTPDDDSISPPEEPADAGDAAPPAPPAGSRGRVAARVATVLAAVVLAAVLAVWGLVAFAVVPPDRVCGPCHRAQAAALAKSVHAAGAHCYDCHSAPDPLSRTARMVRDVTAAFRKGRFAEASVDNAACKRCHARMEKVVEVRGLRMSHSTCVAGISRCTGCHSDVGHGVPAPGRGIDMDACLRCHDGTKATIRCEACHAGKRTASLETTTPWGVTHGPGWKSTHGMGDLTTCRICHDVLDCSRCHLPVPHSADWSSRHGREALAKGRDKCTLCHVPQLCDGCHGTPMPHPKGWLAVHSKATSPAQAKGMCRACHVEADCTECHEMHVHPGIPPDALRRMRAR